MICPHHISSEDPHFVAFLKSYLLTVVDKQTRFHHVEKRERDACIPK